MNAKFPATLKSLRAMLKWITESIAKMEFDPSALRKIELSAEEALVNIITYAYSGRPEEIAIQIKVIPKSHVEIAITDRGPAFNPLEYKEASLDGDIETRDIGGLGIHLMKRNMDSVHYKRIKNANILTLIKKK